LTSQKHHSYGQNFVADLRPGRAAQAPPSDGRPGDGKGDEEGAGEGHAGVVVEESRPETKNPPLYNVVLLNDDYTPMEFVVDVLERFFRMDRSTATRVMLEVHVRGKGVCGVFTYEIAETKVAQVTTYSRDNQHPLLCTLEEA
jgi:ATP-dependent Clp protease adaptor protein ClpS